ncbi:alpha/beta hydrolase [Hyphomonas sp.]|uniref:alpha/beta hydrolase n=1 Tax=Hyphomonas sp. TaxID=87 RepID=UPI003001A1B3
MDIYRPDGDTEAERPVFILAFGGGFTEGNRRNPLVVSVAESLARRGYVTASIDYRFFEGAPVTTDDANIVIIEAMYDMRAAVRFLRQDAQGADVYGTRDDAVFVGGISSGGIMASFAGALDLGDGLSSNVRNYLLAHNGTAGDSSANTGVSSDIQGVFSISGGLTDFLWIDADTAPIYAAHEEFDPTVPCRYALGDAGFSLAGGCDMVQIAQSYGVDAELYLVAGSSEHVGYSNAQVEEFLDGAAAFFAAKIP